MADEGSFLRAILANPADDLPRLVYADWLDEQQTEGLTLKAEFLRLTAASAAKSRNKQRRKFEPRLMELARILPTEWLAVVSRSGVENCQAAGNSIRQPLPTLQFDYQCPRRWEALTPTAEVAVRHCEACQQNVYYCDSITEAREHARQGHCVAVDMAVPRTDGDLAPPRFRMGRVMPNSRAERDGLERIRRATEVDEVSEERERRKQEQRARKEELSEQPPEPRPNNNTEPLYG